jgi:hypothetical protein
MVSAVRNWWGGPWSDTPISRRLCASALFSIVVSLVVGCDMRAFDLVVNARSDVQPTPWVEGTLRAAVGATASAAFEALPPTPTARLAARAPAGAPAAQRPPATWVPAIPMMPASTPTPADTTRVQAVDFNAYRLGSEWTFIQGFAQNSGSATAVSIDIAVSLIGDGDVTVASVHAHVKPEMLTPGGRSPWLAQVRGAPDFSRVRVRVEARPVSDSWPAAVTQDLRLDDVTARPPADLVSSPTIDGEIVNTSDRPLTEVEVRAAIYDETNALIQVARVLVNTKELAPGERAPFVIRPLGRGLKEIRKYELFAEGRPKP